jgi:hypothetical protein
MPGYSTLFRPVRWGRKCSLKRALVLLVILHDRHGRERFDVRVALFAAFVSSRKRVSKTHCSGDGE